MVKKKRRPPPPRNDAELVERLRKQEPDLLAAEVDFDDLVDRILLQPAEKIGEKPK